MKEKELEEKMADFAERLCQTERRCKELEDALRDSGVQEKAEKPVELDLILPEADIDGLHFNETKVHAVFEKKADGWYYSRDILFLSARNAENDNSRDILTKYLAWDVNMKVDGTPTLRQQIAEHFGVAPVHVDISLPKESGGVKQYNGVDWWYWLEGKHSGSAASFCSVHANGDASSGRASVVGGCAPAFRIVGQEG
jgi:hypothetical protein